MRRTRVKVGQTDQKDQSYAGINNGFTLNNDYDPALFTCFADGWIVFSHNGRNAGDDIKAGWKAHIGIDDSVPGNMEKAWNITLPILRHHEIGQGKVVPDNKGLASKDTKLCGKQLTIYCYKQTGSVVNWAAFFTEVTQALREKGVRPAPLPENDLKLQGSEYISYRNDSDAGGEYDENSTYDSAIHGENPFASIVINAAGTEAARPQFQPASGGSSSTAPRWTPRLGGSAE